MTRAALDFASMDSLSLVLEFDQFVNTKSELVARLCDHLNVAFDEEFVEELTTPVGTKTRTIALSESEYLSIAHYEDHYQQLCDRFGLKRRLRAEDVHEKYRWKSKAEVHDTRYDGLTTNRLRGIVRQKDSQIKRLKTQIEELLHAVVPDSRLPAADT